MSDKAKPSTKYVKDLNLAAVKPVTVQLIKLPLWLRINEGEA